MCHSASESCLVGGAWVLPDAVENAHVHVCKLENWLTLKFWCMAWWLAVHTYMHAHTSILPQWYNCIQDMPYAHHVVSHVTGLCQPSITGRGSSCVASCLVTCYGFLSPSLQVCHYYLRGACSYGSSCRYDHVSPKEQEQKTETVR